MIKDGRFHHQATIEDPEVAYFRMSFNGGGRDYETTRLPYNILNSGDALAAVVELCPGAGAVRRYGYLHTVRDSAVTPVDRVMASVYCVER